MQQENSSFTEEQMQFDAFWLCVTLPGRGQAMATNRLFSLGDIIMWRSELGIQHRKTI